MTGGRRGLTVGQPWNELLEINLIDLAKETNAKTNRTMLPMESPGAENQMTFDKAEASDPISKAVAFVYSVAAMYKPVHMA